MSSSTCCAAGRERRNLSARPNFTIMKRRGVLSPIRQKVPVQADTDVVSLLISDTHFSHVPPAARVGDWYKTQLDYIDQLVFFLPSWEIPIIVAGDLLNHWKEPPELVNFLLKHLPEVWAIPGQHDLPMHRYEDIKKSAFWTLVEAGRVKLLKPDGPTAVSKMSNGRTLYTHAFPWGFPVAPLSLKVQGFESVEGDINLAVIHRYVWINHRSYEGAPEEQRAKNCPLDGYDAAVFGDNHNGFLTTVGTTEVLNCGCFIRRKTDELNYQPKVGFLHVDGTITTKDLDCSKDQFMTATEPKDQGNGDGFIEELRQLGEKAIDFADVLCRKAAKEREGVRDAVLEALENG